LKLIAASTCEQSANQVHWRQLGAKMSEQSKGEPSAEIGEGLSLRRVKSARRRKRMGKSCLAQLINLGRLNTLNANNGPPAQINLSQGSTERRSNPQIHAPNPLIALNLRPAEEDAAREEKPERSGANLEEANERRRRRSTIDGDDFDPSIGSVEEVRGNFIALLSYSKLQGFYLGTLAYSVMMICLVLYANLSADSSHSDNRADRNSSIHEAGGHDYTTPANRPAELIYEPNWLLLSLTIGATFLLASIAALTTIKFSAAESLTECENKQQVQGQNCGAKRENLELRLSLLKFAGLITTLLLLYLPPFMLTFGGPESWSQMSLDSLHLPIGATLALVYMQPLLLEGSSLNAKLVGAITNLPLLILALLPLLLQSPSVASETRFGDLALVAVICSPLILFLAILRRHKFTATVTRDTFSGASQLIEAKVSLEHQRQQQETLLLSVLPAYVAEQVKRNMLKKITNPSPHPSSNSLDQAEPTQNSTNQPAVSMHSQQAPISPQLVSTSVCHSPSRGAITLGGSSSYERGQAQVQPEVQRDLQVQLNPRIKLKNSSLMPTTTTTTTSTGAFVGHEQRARNETSTFVSQAQQSPNQVNAIPQHVNTPFAGQVRRGFNELYIRTYNNVSLLYGDIVGFTRLCTQLSSSQLVRVLNDLFSHFDHLAEKHKIMRIKILGDCYYGVGGIPEFAVLGAKSRASNKNENHAINCVNMGLEMINYIRKLNIERASNGESLTRSVSNVLEAELRRTGGRLDRTDPRPVEGHRSAGSGQLSPLPPFELNMRIGIHTGHIHSGVIGLKKWQFDVWSNDVSIAMHCESSGIAGRVQVTDATITHLNGAFTYEKAGGAERDSFLATKDIRTYLIKDRAKPSLRLLAKDPSERDRKLMARRREQCRVYSKSTSSADTEAQHNLDEDNIRAATIGTIRQTLLAGETCNSNTLNSYGLALNHQDMKLLTLDFYESTLDKLFANQPVEGLYWELATILLLLLVLALIASSTGLPPDVDRLTLSLPVLFVFLILLASFRPRIGSTEVARSGSKMVAQVDGLTSESSPLKPHEVIRMKGDKSCYCFLDSIRTQLIRINSFTPKWLKLTRIFAIDKRKSKLRSAAITLVFITVILVQIYLNQKRICHEIEVAQRWSSKVDQNVGLTEGFLFREQNQLSVIILLISMDSSLNLLTYKTRLFFLFVVVGLNFYSTWPPIRLQETLCLNSAVNFGESIRRTSVSKRQVIDWWACAILTVMAIWSYAFARQLEYTNRANFLWRNRLNVDHEELEYISGINKVLLENILPSHVVQYYLTHPSEQPRSRLPTLQAYMRMSKFRFEN